MKEIIVGPGENDMRLDKLLQKYMELASSGFIYKMLRKKNITLNGKKAEGRERLKEGDRVILYLSDDTIASFQKKKLIKELINLNDLPEIIYEDDNIIIANKAAGVLSQKAREEDLSVNEILKAYCFEKYGNNGLFTPSVCNRLDRNTSGIITFGKTLEGSRDLSRLFKERALDKYYIALVKGETDRPLRVSDYLLKDEKENKVSILKEPKDNAFPIETEYRPLIRGGGHTLMEIKLITGKSHQIRAHLAAKGFPIVGDLKYGVMEYSAKYQLLHARRIVFPKQMSGCLEALAGKEIVADVPYHFIKIINKLYPEFNF